MSNNWLPVEILLTQYFKKNLTQLAKRYRSIRKDLEPLIECLKLGEILGEQISGSNYQVFKVRLKNSNIQKGKSAGYRVIYYLKKGCLLSRYFAFIPTFIKLVFYFF